MTDGAMTGGSIGVWAIAIIILISMFGNGNLFGCNHGWNNCGNVGYGFGGDCVTNKNVLETLFATSTATTKQLDAISQAQTANWYNLSQKMDNMQADALRQQLQDAKNENLYLRGKIEADARYNSLQAELASIKCNMATRPPFYSCGVIPNGCNYPCSTTTTPTA